VVSAYQRTNYLVSKGMKRFLLKNSSKYVETNIAETEKAEFKKC